MMKTDKEVKIEFKKKASNNPDHYYATSVLKCEGFERNKCNCGTYYWSTTGEGVCGDPACSGGFRFIGKKVARDELDYIGVWKKFSRLFEKWGYTPIGRYPVAARWRNDTDFVQASIYDFQPYVVSGEVEPPANPLVVPQFCLRFNDVDNVGVTGAHYTGFVMIGQHAFMPPKEWDQAKYFGDIHSWLRKGLGLKNNDIVYHEDAWAGGGNFGPCMEYFSHGLELGNQVYMQYERIGNTSRELKLKVLDMGMGHERNAWFTQGKCTSYETTFPSVCKKLYKITGVNVNDKLMAMFLPYSSYLNIDEVDDINKTWKFVANKVGVEVDELRQHILPLSQLYSVAEHTRSLLVALNDGALPSNVGGGYNLRVILRRALGFVEKNDWDISLQDVAEWHAKYLKKMFPELLGNLDEVNEILEVEKNKYDANKDKSRNIVSKIVQNEVNVKKLLELYDSHGVSPEMLVLEADKTGKNIEVPDNFYALVASLHEQKEQVHATKKDVGLGLDDEAETKALYYDDYLKVKGKSKVVRIIDKNVVLDGTIAYPTSGGQVHDIGKIDFQEFVDVFKQGNKIVHVMKDTPEFKVGSLVVVEIDLERRRQLSQHHTATHIINAAAKKVLGNHINQAGAKKNVDKASIDITHYQALTEEEIEEIEGEANKIVGKAVSVDSKFYPRTSAEQKFGMRIYQGGAVPGNNLRIVNIKNIDVEACGGTHLKNTSEAGKIKIVKVSKISDSIVRLVFTAGDAAVKVSSTEKGVVEEAAKILRCLVEEVPGRALELFILWKKVVKKKKQVDSRELVSTEKYKGDVFLKTAEVLKTQPEHVIKTLKRFKSEIGLK